MGRSIPFFGAASRADGDTRFGVSLRCIQNQDGRCLVPAGVDIVHHIVFPFSLFYCSLTTASPEEGDVYRDLRLRSQIVTDLVLKYAILMFCFCF